jgi:hypothetical protein
MLTYEELKNNARNPILCRRCGANRYDKRYSQSQHMRTGNHASTLYRDERAPKFLYDVLCMLLTITTVLLCNTLFGDKGRGVMASRLQ